MKYVTKFRQPQHYQKHDIDWLRISLMPSSKPSSRSRSTRMIVANCDWVMLLGQGTGRSHNASHRGIALASPRQPPVIRSRSLVSVSTNLISPYGRVAPWILEMIRSHQPAASSGRVQVNTRLAQTHTYTLQPVRAWLKVRAQWLTQALRHLQLAI